MTNFAVITNVVIKTVHCILFSGFHKNTSSLVGWLVVLGLTVLSDSILVYIGPSPRKREKEKRFGWLVVLGLTAL